ncbi:MAG: hypothetical protein VKS61_09950 [Candidatus Sericytochromatia bacterium]|nr:hypothetical protein [Candidatus Sericytochromatia bacterium]
MTRPLQHLENLRAWLPGLVDRAGLLELWALALHGGAPGAEVAAWFQALPVTPDAALLREALLAGEPRNPEWEQERSRDAGLERRVAALLEHAQPGDMVFWRSLEPGFPWWVMRTVYGPWMHVSVVLADGRLLDPYWPEGAVIVTPEAAMAKNSRRIRACELLVARPTPPLDAAAVARLTAAAEALVGRPYNLLSTPDRPSPGASCARNAWELMRDVGVDLLAQRPRLFNSSISPRDIVPSPVVWIRSDGSVVHDDAPGSDPVGAFGSLVRWVEQRCWGFPGVERVVLSLDKPLTVAFMVAMLPARLRWAAPADPPGPETPPQGSG